MRRSLQILPYDFDASSHTPPTIEDFYDEIYTSEVYNPETKTMLTSIFASQCHLAVAITMLLVTLFAASGPTEDPGFLLLRANDLKARLVYWKESQVVQVSPQASQSHPSVAFYHQLTSLYYEYGSLNGVSTI
jgi:hypothetical protein